MVTIHNPNKFVIPVPYRNMGNKQRERRKPSYGEGNSLLKQDGGGNNWGESVEEEAAIQSVGEHKKEDTKEKVAPQNDIGHRVFLPPSERGKDLKQGINTDHAQDNIGLKVRLS